MFNGQRSLPPLVLAPSGSAVSSRVRRLLRSSSCILLSWMLASLFRCCAKLEAPCTLWRCSSSFDVGATAAEPRSMLSTVLPPCRDCERAYRLRRHRPPEWWLDEDAVSVCSSSSFSLSFISDQAESDAPHRACRRPREKWTTRVPQRRERERERRGQASLVCRLRRNRKTSRQRHLIQFDLHLENRYLRSFWRPRQAQENEPPRL